MNSFSGRTSVWVYLPVSRWGQSEPVLLPDLQLFLGKEKKQAAALSLQLWVSDPRNRAFLGKAALAAISCSPTFSLLFSWLFILMNDDSTGNIGRKTIGTEGKEPITSLMGHGCIPTRTSDHRFVRRHESSSLYSSNHRGKSRHSQNSYPEKYIGFSRSPSSRGEAMHRRSIESTTFSCVTGIISAKATCTHLGLGDSRSLLTGSIANR